MDRSVLELLHGLHEGNPLTGVPRVFAPSKPHHRWRRLDYLDDFEAGAEQRLRVRVLLLGDGAAGKTTLAGCLEGLKSMGRVRG